MPVEEITNAERAALVRFCARYTRDPMTAEDLAQRTLLAAWRHEQQLRDPQARRSWLFSIARRECLTWARQRDRQLVPLESLAADDPAREPAANVDLAAGLAHADLLRLLDEALRRLPPGLREVLVRRYLDELSQAEVALRLGLSEAAVEARLHRGKRALRQVICTDLSADAVALGLIAGRAARWEETPVWCPGCGRRKLEGWFERSEGRLHMRCPGCSQASGAIYDSLFIYASGPRLKDLKTFKPAVSYVLDTIHTQYRAAATQGTTPCPRCGEQIRILQGVPPGTGDRLGPADGGYFYLWHPACGLRAWETWHSLTWSLPEARRFWKAHPRMRFLPPRPIDFAGSPAVVTGFESCTEAARLEVISLRGTLEVVRIAGTPDENAHG